ncbi:MAG: XylR family transcriptional regulator [Planctomycetaceae bacterium]
MAEGSIPSKRRSVALLIETSNAYSRGVLDGVISCVRQLGTWSVYLPEQERGASAPDWLTSWKGDGIIARIENAQIAKAVRKTGLPTVDISAGRFLPDVPWVETDDKAIATLAAQHLLERGFHHMAFCGDPGFNWSVWRESRFAELTTEAGCTYHVHQSLPRTDEQYSWTKDRTQLARWLRQLPRPVGIMACYDIKAQQLLSICRDENISVPEEVAVIGVDNDRRLCELCDPPLSSVVPNSWKTGYQAATLLNDMMNGETVSPTAHLIVPLGVETRQSTDILAIDDEHVVAALRFIRNEACSGIDVSDVLKQVPLSRRALESRFVKLTGRTPHSEITRIRIERVKSLLLETDLTLTAIAERAGFRHVEYLSVAFRKATGQTPREFRRQVLPG